MVRYFSVDPFFEVFSFLVSCLFFFLVGMKFYESLFLLIFCVQRQWWEFKSKHMDKVLFFKVCLYASLVK